MNTKKSSIPPIYKIQDNFIVMMNKMPVLQIDIS